MKKLNSLEDLGSLLSEEFKTKKQPDNENVLAKTFSLSGCFFVLNSSESKEPKSSNEFSFFI